MKGLTGVSVGFGERSIVYPFWLFTFSIHLLKLEGFVDVPKNLEPFKMLLQ